MAQERICLFCTHCSYDPGWGGTDVTAGDPASFSCNKGHFTFRCPDSVEEYRELVLTAVNCKDYDEVKR